MLHKLKNRKQEGFTIIEVLIVLAIAGLIILIVLLAVPALQRSGRNTGMKNDAGAITGGVSEYASNNDGAIPAVAIQNGATVTFCDANPCGGSVSQSTAKVQGSTVVHYESAPTPTPANYAVGNIDVDFKYKCTSSNGAGVTGSPRSTAVIYTVEAASGSNTVRCVDA